MKQLTKMEKLLDHYETELELWKISKKKARSLGQPLPVQNFNIERIEERIAEIKEVIAYEDKLRIKSLGEQLAGDHIRDENRGMKNE